ncbi:MAG TPA: TIGR04282 family arsenosugar biosynthesis glycosyltransferase [Burkholderiales bacterium]|nr:TIGR04282 family arsenosugar biosynthesis glycosyltransferase [Burkholderiales bacterium]
MVVIVFARAPLPGRVKTRLVPRLGEWGAARLQARLTRQAVRTALAARCGEVQLHVTPRARHPFFISLARELLVGLRPQQGRDLGERMYRALRAGLHRHRAVLLIGADCPALGPRDLRRAARFLQGGADVVLAPAEDGGYALIGARRVSRRLFDGIAWGETGVYAQTAERLRALNYRWRALRTVWDVDRPADLDRFRSLRLSSARPLASRR